MTSESAVKRSRGSEPSTPWLLRHIDVVCDNVLPFLSRRDIVVLLSLCRALRNDRTTIARVFQQDPTTRHFGHNCISDWCAYFSNSFYFSTWDLCEDSHRVEDQVLGERILNDRVDKRLSLLSLVGLVEKELSQVLRKHLQAYAINYCFLPFIWPTSLPRQSTDEQFIEELDAVGKGLGKIMTGDRFFSEIGLHFENMKVSEGENGPHVNCEFCSGHAEALRTHFDGDGDTEENTRAMCEDGRLSHIMMLDGRAITDVVVESSCWEFTEGVCPQLVAPTKLFFEKHGFKRVLRQRLPQFDDCCGEEELRRVEVIGGMSPSGFFAGVMVVNGYT